MSDTGEQGALPADPIDRAGVGAGIVPDDLSEGELQEQELEQERETWGDGPQHEAHEAQREREREAADAEQLESPT